MQYHAVAAGLQAKHPNTRLQIWDNANPPSTYTYSELINGIWNDFYVTVKFCHQELLGQGDLLQLGCSLKRLRWWVYGLGTYVKRTPWMHIWCFHMLEHACYYRDLSLFSCKRVEAMNKLHRADFLSGPGRGQASLGYAHDKYMVRDAVESAGYTSDDKTFSRHAASAARK